MVGKSKDVFDRFRPEQLQYLRDYFREVAREGLKDVTTAVRNQDMQKASEKVGKMDYCDQLASTLDREVERRSSDEGNS